MPTGIEIAGVVLAVFPFCIGLVKLYINGTSTIHDMRHHHRILERFHRELKLEHCKLSDSLFNLFEDTISGGECERIFQDPKAAAARLKERLDGRPNVADIFIATMIAIKDELENLQEKFWFEELERDFPTAVIGAGLDLILLGNSKDDIDHIQSRIGSKKYTKLSKRAMKNLRKRTLACLKEELVERMKYLRNSNEDISKLVNGAQQCAANLESQAHKKNLSGVDGYYREVREEAKYICDILQQKVQVPHGCRNREHAVSLCLEVRDAHGAERKLRYGTRLTRDNEERLYRKIQFKVAICLRETQPEAARIWKELEVESVLETASELFHKVKNHPQPLPSLRTVPVPDQRELEGTVGQRIVVAQDTLYNDFSSLTVDPATPLGSNSRPTTPNKQSRISEGFGSIIKQASRVIRRPKSRRVSFATASDNSRPTSPDIVMTQSHNSPSGSTPGSNSHGQQLQSSSCTQNPTPPSDTGLHQIHDFCLTIQQPTTLIQRQCIGLLQSNPGSQTYYRVWAIPAGGCFDLVDKLKYCSRSWPADDEPIPLKTLLEGNKTGFGGSSLTGSFPLSARLSLGITLASSVIQLHQTRWLNDFWDKQDILFFRDPETKNPLTRAPMVLHKLDNFNNSNTSVGGPTMERVGVAFRKNKVLFSLGLVLSELWFGTTLDEICCEDRLQAGEHSLDYREWSEGMLIIAAHRALRAVQDDAPVMYSDAVQACLYDNISTESEDFPTTVWQRVVRPLQENFSHYRY